MDSDPSIRDMWQRLISYASFINASLYLLVALIASVLHARKLWRVVILTFLGALAGVLITFLLAGIPSLLLATIYRLLDTSMSDADAVVIGCAQGAVIAMLSAGIFHRIL